MYGENWLNHALWISTYRTIGCQALPGASTLILNCSPREVSLHNPRPPKQNGCTDKVVNPQVSVKGSSTNKSIFAGHYLFLSIINVPNIPKKAEGPPKGLWRPPPGELQPTNGLQKVTLNKLSSTAHKISQYLFLWKGNPKWNA